MTHNIKKISVNPRTIIWPLIIESDATASALWFHFIRTATHEPANAEKRSTYTHLFDFFALVFAIGFQYDGQIWPLFIETIGMVSVFICVLQKKKMRVHARSWYFPLAQTHTHTSFLYTQRTHTHTHTMWKHKWIRYTMRKRTQRPSASKPVLGALCCRYRCRNLFETWKCCKKWAKANERSRENE